MKISKLKINKLFGIHDYELELSFPERVRILHAQNGMGKTTVLSMVSAVLSLDIEFLNNVPFKSVLIELDNGESIEVTKEDIFSSIFESDNEAGSLDYSALYTRNDRNERTNKILFILRNGKGNEKTYETCISRENWMYENHEGRTTSNRFYYREKENHESKKGRQVNTAKSNRIFMYKMKEYASSLPVNMISADRLHSYDRRSQLV